MGIVGSPADRTGNLDPRGLGNMEDAVKRVPMPLLALFVLWLMFFPFSLWGWLWHRLWVILGVLK